LYGFLPYQPRLFEYGFDCSIVHEVRAVRDPTCDETLFQTMTSGRDGSLLNFKYSPDSPLSDLWKRHSPMPCYLSSTDEYTKALHRRAAPTR
jgi:hypothetical protein